MVCRNLISEVSEGRCYINTNKGERSAEIARGAAYSPDISGCIATGNKKKEVEKRMKEAIEFHLDGLREEGIEIPSPKTYSQYIEMAA